MRKKPINRDMIYNHNSISDVDTFIVDKPDHSGMSNSKIAFGTIYEEIKDRISALIYTMYSNVIIVTQGEDNAISTAVNTITDATAENRYKVIITPGSYTENTSIYKEYVDYLFMDCIISMSELTEGNAFLFNVDTGDQVTIEGNIDITGGFLYCKSAKVIIKDKVILRGADYDTTTPNIVIEDGVVDINKLVGSSVMSELSEGEPIAEPRYILMLDGILKIKEYVHSDDGIGLDVNGEDATFVTSNSIILSDALGLNIRVTGNLNFLNPTNAYISAEPELVTVGEGEEAVESTITPIVETGGDMIVDANIEAYYSELI